MVPVAAAPAGQVSAACVGRDVPEAEELFASTEALLGQDGARWVPDPPPSHGAALPGADLLH